MAKVAATAASARSWKSLWLLMAGKKYNSSVQNKTKKKKREIGREKKKAHGLVKIVQPFSSALLLLHEIEQEHAGSMKFYFNCWCNTNFRKIR